MSNPKLWGGRFSEASSRLVDSFNASVSFDYQLYPYDIQGSIAHVKMLAKCKIISIGDKNKIIIGLEKIKKEVEAGKFKWDPAYEDVHLNIESRLIDLIGPCGGKLHTARSRNDQIALDLRLYAKDKVNILLTLLKEFQTTLLAQAKKNINTFLPGYTHLQRAQPVSLAHHLLAYIEMASRDEERLKESLERLDVLPLGSGALSGTSFPINREYVAALLGFKKVSRNSMDAVSDRDFILEILGHLSILMMHLSRLSEEWIIWSSQEFNFIKLPEGYCTGSSMMPQKMNPDLLELIRGKTGRVYGSLVTLLTLLKGLPLTYNKDLQEDKEPFFDAMTTTQNSLQILCEMIRKTQFNVEVMEKANAEGFVLATEIADYLTAKGIPFREAHRSVGTLVRYCQKHNKSFDQLTLKELKKLDNRFDETIFEILSISVAVDRKKSTGGTSRQQIKKEIKRLEKRA